MEDADISMKLRHNLTIWAAMALASFASASAQELFVYDNVVNFGGQFYANGGAANQSGNTITTLVADDITPIPGYAGQTISNIYFSVVNGNAAAVSARPRLRIYDSTGTGGGPGTILAAFSFNPISFGANSANIFYFNPGGLTVPSGTFWMGLTFDDNGGATGATLAQMNNLGMAFFNPPTVGTSADIFFQTTSAGSFNANNPAGTLANFGGNPPANFGFGVSVVPEPSTLVLAALGLGALTIFRRRN